MRLARIVFRDSPWWLEDDTETNPEVGTIVQVMAYTNGDVAFSGPEVVFMVNISV